MKQFEVRLEYKIIVSARDEFHAENYARQDLDVFTAPHSVFVIEKEKDQNETKN